MRNVVFQQQHLVLGLAIAHVSQQAHEVTLLKDEIRFRQYFKKDNRNCCALAQRYLGVARVSWPRVDDDDDAFPAQRFRLSRLDSDLRDEAIGCAEQVLASLSEKNTKLVWFH